MEVKKVDFSPQKLIVYFFNKKIKYTRNEDEGADYLHHIKFITRHYTRTEQTTMKKQSTNFNDVPGICILNF